MKQMEAQVVAHSRNIMLSEAKDLKMLHFA